MKRTRNQTATQSGQVTIPKFTCWVCVTHPSSLQRKRGRGHIWLEKGVS